LALTAAQRFGPIVGVIGSVTLLVASLIAALAYSGTTGEPYSPLNHWVSELGERGVSALALLFNVGLIVGGISLAVFMTALGLLRRSRWARLYVPVGVAAGVSGAFVGVFPMNEIGIHRIAALGFFLLGWIAVGLASIDIWRDPDERFPRWLPALGALTVLTFLAFLALYIPSLTYTGTDTSRPAMSLVVMLEWLVLVGIIVWVLVASLSWWRYDRGHRA
jgi:hypothetical membrane protein